MTDQDILSATKLWLEQAVIGLNLCPFAKAVHVKGQIRYAISHATDTTELHDALTEEINLLLNTPADQIDTTLLIHPQVLTDFFEYNDFLERADRLLVKLDADGALQIASFHPDYQFQGTQSDDLENYTNRSPYPILHLIREASIDKALASYPDPDNIYQRNIDTLNRIGLDGWRQLFIDPDID